MKKAAVVSFILAATAAIAQMGRIAVDPSGHGHPIGPMFNGLMTEEINHSYDGGLYGELIRDRNFLGMPEISKHWQLESADGKAQMELVGTEDDSIGPTSRYLNIQTSGTAELSNDGFWGIPVRPHTLYHAALFIRSADPTSGLTVKLETADGSKVWAKTSLPPVTGGWQVLKADLKTGEAPTSAANRFVIDIPARSQIELAEASLFGPTYHNRPNGNRIDLMELLAGMEPKFLRFPGGNYLEGNTIPERFEWKNTIGSIWKRAGHQGPWGYRSSDGLGLLEFLEWCEDLHMQPLLAVYAGYSLNGDHVDPGAALDPYVQDALDEIEYVTGGTDTKWGAERSRDGHPKPFSLSYVEIGNEDWFDRSGSYDGRFAQFYDAIKAKYPSLQLIATAPVKSRTPDVIDDHYYRPPAAMALDSGHYDNYSRSGPKVFVGEWASIKGSPTPTFAGALGDAAWLTGLERDSDVVVMESYAPLLVNVENGAAQWGTNLIGYDALRSFGSPSYWVQKLFAENTGDRTIPVSLDLHTPPPPPPVFHGAVGVGTWMTQAEFKDLSVTHDGKTLFAADPAKGLQGWKLKGDWSVVDGALRQSSSEEGCYAVSGDKDWKNYTVEVKARKIAGPEGFLVLFHYAGDDSYRWWNIGGWGDTRTELQDFSEDGGIRGRPSDFKVETGRWYDLKLVVKNGVIQGYVDGKLVSQGSEVKPQVPPIYVAASRYGSSGDVVLKVVNFGDSAMPLSIDLGGFSPSRCSAWQMTGDLSAQNSVSEPRKIVPKRISIDAARDFQHTFPAHSITVLRLGGDEGFNRQSARLARSRA